MATQFWVAAVAVVLCVTIVGRHDGAAAAGAHLCQRHWPGHALAGVCRHRARAGQPPTAARGPGAERRGHERLAHHRARCWPAPSSPARAAPGCLCSTPCCRCSRASSSCAGSASPPVSPLGRERLPSAMRVGVQFVRQSPALRAVLWRISVFFLHATALLALLPLVAKGLEGGGAGTFTLLLASMGAGAIVAALFLPRLRQAMPRDALVLRGTLQCRPPPPADGLGAQRVRGRARHGAGRHGLDHHRPTRSACQPSWPCPTGCARAACPSTRWPSWAPPPQARRCGARWPPSLTTVQTSLPPSAVSGGM
jgi:hypothetical protein